MGWFVITLLVLWSIGVVVNVFSIGSQKAEYVSPRGCVASALFAAGLGLAVIFLTPGTLTFFGVILAAYYFMWTVADTGFAFTGGFTRPTWWPWLGIVLGIFFIVMTLTVGVSF